jgi:hypothetical protein
VVFLFPPSHGERGYPFARSKGKCPCCGKKDYRQWNAGAVRTHKLLFLGEQRKKEITCISGNPFGLIGVPNPAKRGLQQPSLRRPELSLRLTREDKLTNVVPLIERGVLDQ